MYLSTPGYKRVSGVLQTHGDCTWIRSVFVAVTIDIGILVHEFFPDYKNLLVLPQQQAVEDIRLGDWRGCREFIFYLKSITRLVNSVFFTSAAPRVLHIPQKIPLDVEVVAVLAQDASCEVRTPRSSILFSKLP